MEKINYWLIALFALAFYWLYQNGKKQTHETTAAAFNQEAGNTSTEPKIVTEYKTIEVLKDVPWKPKKGNFINPTLYRTDFTIVKAKTPFIYEN